MEHFIKKKKKKYEQDMEYLKKISWIFQLRKR